MDPTPNLGLERPDFNIATWHDQVNGNFTILDAAVAGLVNIVGLWDNSVTYIVGDFVVDATDSTIWECLVSHTSSSTGVMAADRAANPTYWQLAADIATLVAEAQNAADAAQASAAAAAASAAQAQALVDSLNTIQWVNIKMAPYNAIGDGVSDDSQAFVDFTLDYAGQEVGLLVPPGTYLIDSDDIVFFDPGSPGNLFAGIDKLTIYGYGASFIRGDETAEWHMGGGTNIDGDGNSTITQNEVGVARIQSVYPGDDEVTVVTPGEAAQYAVGDWLCISGIDLQGYGHPQNFMFFEFQQIYDITGDVIRFTRSLKNTYLSTWPLYTAGGPGVEETDYGGPATIFKMGAQWGMELAIHGVHFLNRGLIHNRCRKMTYVDCILEGEPMVSVVQHIEYLRCEIAVNPVTSIWEWDKLVETCTLRQCNVYQQLQISSSNGADYTIIENSDITTMRGTPRRLHVSDSRINTLTPGPRFAGQCQEMVFVNTFVKEITAIEAEKRDNYGAEIGDWTSYAGGIIQPEAAPVTWAFPGAKIVNLTTGDPEFGSAPFEILEVYDVAGDTFIKTTLPDPLPDGDNWIGDFVVDHPCPNATFINCHGCALVEDMSAGPNGVPLYSYASRTYTGAGETTSRYYDNAWDNTNMRVRGTVKEIRVDVIRAYTGIEATLEFRRTTGISMASTAAFDEFTINAKIAGERVITEDDFTGQETGDNVDLAGFWIANHIPYFELSEDISAEAPNTWPIIKVTVHTDQGIIGHSHYIPSVAGAVTPGAAERVVREVTAAGSITVDADDDDIIVVNKTVGAATTVNLPAVATRAEGRAITVVDGKLDAATNNITVDADGAETIVGLSTWIISTNGGSITLWPLPSGGRWYIA